jgi:hypothetical protein
VTPVGSSGGLTIYGHDGNVYSTYANAAVWLQNGAKAGAGVTYTGFTNGPTTNQYAASSGRAFDEWGTICVGSPVHSSYPNGATGYSCNTHDQTFYSRGISYAYNVGSSPATWNPSYTKTTGYAYFANPRGGSIESELTSGVELVTAEGWPVNDSGLSYGDARRSATPDDEPDLIQATAINGAHGYVNRAELAKASGSDLLSTGVDNLKAIAEWQATEGRLDHHVPVYALDGETVVGEFLIVGSESQAEVAAIFAKADRD